MWSWRWLADFATSPDRLDTPLLSGFATPQACPTACADYGLTGRATCKLVAAPSASLRRRACRQARTRPRCRPGDRPAAPGVSADASAALRRSKDVKNT